MDRIATGTTWYEGPICGSPGIGAVQAWFTVKVHPQVDGKLENVGLALVRENVVCACHAGVNSRFPLRQKLSV